MQYIVNRKKIPFDNIQIMGILNITPDSFFDGGKYLSISKAIDHVSNMISDGANFIDVGGESTRPGASIVHADEEADRVVPIVRAISERFDVFISVNTSKSLVIRESALVGAHLINDIRALSEPGSLESILDFPELSVCLVHMQGTPNNMQQAPYYQNVIQDICHYFVQQIIRCELAGLKRTRLFLDPGFGFGKSLAHNYQLLSSLKDFRRFRLPLMVGISRKSMLDVSGSRIPNQRLIASISCAVIAAIQGVQVLRVHDVKETVEALRIVQATFKNKELFLYEPK